MIIRGNVHDLQPTQSRPRLELYFDAKHRPVLPHGKQELIVLHLEGVCWHGTMNSVNSSNRPYVHTWLRRDDGTESTCTDVFQSLGLAEKAQLEFELRNRNNFRLIDVVDQGTWR